MPCASHHSVGRALVNLGPLSVRSCAGRPWHSTSRAWVGPVKMDSEQRQVGFQVVFKLVGQSVAGCRMAAVKVEIGVEVVGDFQAGFFQGSKGATAGQQFRLEGAPAGFGLGVVAVITWPAEAG